MDTRISKSLRPRNILIQLLHKSFKVHLYITYKSKNWWDLLCDIAGWATTSNAGFLSGHLLTCQVFHNQYSSMLMAWESSKKKIVQVPGQLTWEIRKKLLATGFGPRGHLGSKSTDKRTLSLPLSQIFKRIVLMYNVSWRCSKWLTNKITKI